MSIINENKVYNYPDIQPITGKLDVLGYNPKIGSFEFSPKTVNINVDLLLPTLFSLDRARHSIKLYIALLSRLETNDKAVYMRPSEIQDIFKCKSGSKEVYNCSKILEKARLIVREKGKYNYYYINPVFAWRGNRLDYIKIDSLPFFASVPAGAVRIEYE